MRNKIAKTQSTDEVFAEMAVLDAACCVVEEAAVVIADEQLTAEDIINKGWRWVAEEGADFDARLDRFTQAYAEYYGTTAPSKKDKDRETKRFQARYPNASREVQARNMINALLNACVC
jgi:hypothetical protein